MSANAFPRAVLTMLTPLEISWREAAACVCPALFCRRLCFYAAVPIHLASFHLVCRGCIGKSFGQPGSSTRERFQVLQELCCLMQG